MEEDKLKEFEIVVENYDEAVEAKEFLDMLERETLVDEDGNFLVEEGTEDVYPKYLHYSEEDNAFVLETTKSDKVDDEHRLTLEMARFAAAQAYLYAGGLLILGRLLGTEGLLAYLKACGE